MRSEQVELDTFDPRRDRTYTVEVTFFNGVVETHEHLTYSEADRYFGRRDPRIVSVDLYSEA